MDQHKHNPTAQLAKAGKLPPNKTKRRINKRETDSLVRDAIEALFWPAFRGLPHLFRR